jgi:hypothetical protein
MQNHPFLAPCFKTEYIGPSLRKLYQYIQNPNQGFKIGEKRIWREFTILPTNDVAKYVETYHGKMIDVGNNYLGMGHVLVLSYIPATDNFIFRRDGGSNGHESNALHKEYSAESYSPKDFPLIKSSDILITRLENYDELSILNDVQDRFQYSYNDVMKIIYPEWLLKMC